MGCFYYIHDTTQEIRFEYWMKSVADLSHELFSSFAHDENYSDCDKNKM